MATIRRDATTVAGWAAGVAAPVVFVVTFVVDGWLRAGPGGYDPVSMFVSELSLGPGGWVQKANFVVTGLLVLAFAAGQARAWRASAPPTRAERTVAIALAVLGACLAGSGFFDTDPSAMFSQVSPAGVVHGVLGAFVFLAMPTSCLAAAAGAGHDPGGRTWRRATLGVAVALGVGIVALKVSEQPALGLFAAKGLVQRAVLVLYFAWLAVFALRQRRRGRTVPSRRRAG